MAGEAAGLPDARPWLRLGASGIAAGLGVLLALRSPVPRLRATQRGTLGLILPTTLMAWGIVALAEERDWFDGVSIMLILLITLPAHAATATLRGAPAHPQPDPAALSGSAPSLRLLPVLLIICAGYGLLPPETPTSRLALPLLLTVTIFGIIVLTHDFVAARALPDRINRIAGKRMVRVAAVILSIATGLLVLAAIPTTTDPASRTVAALAGCVIATLIALALSLGVRHPAKFRRSL